MPLQQFIWKLYHILNTSKRLSIASILVHEDRSEIDIHLEDGSKFVIAISETEKFI